MNILLSVVSLAVILGLSGCGVAFFGSWIAEDIREIRNHAF